ncbi:uncharacterized protein EV420DRAFT_1145387 [Desarmillaria tabescens]|uniref:MYND-type domain-containing protein n=1 Tax=Armillaria tabescens TaxID=1929756 RepID=A0AA39TT94_ARMTA|nr:uncharacterized protein EV420DRAFT_1145387 [Desarmillaria tabescens]KAK0462929.1 hypothetical protein EV420DRAFT_1145387 [Desarmillaria tabescens]
MNCNIWVRDSVSGCCQVLAEAFHDGYSWVVEALDHHLSESILKCQSLLDSDAAVREDDDAEPILHMSLMEVLNSVNFYLIYRPVLRSARRSIRHIFETGLEDDFDQNGLLWDVWDRLKEVAGLRWEAREDLAAQEVTKCMNPECATPERALRQCSSCSNAYFCDPVCQRIAWRLEHKKSCHERRGMAFPWDETKPVLTTHIWPRQAHHRPGYQLLLRGG